MVKTKAEFARAVGVTGAAITKAIAGDLGPALVGSRIDDAHPAAIAYRDKHDRRATDGLDPAYIEVVEYLASKNTYSVNAIRKHFKFGADRARRILDTMRLAGHDKPGAVVPKQADAPPAPPAEPADVATKELEAAGTPPDDIKALLDMTLTEIHAQHGTTTALLDYLKATQTVEAINAVRLKNAKAEGILVSREAVRVGVFEPIEAAHLRLMTDGAKTIAKRVTAMHDAEHTLEEIEQFITDQVSSFLKPLKAKTARALRSA